MEDEIYVCADCGTEDMDNFYCEYNDDYCIRCCQCIEHSEGCPTCDFDVCQCDAMYDNYKDSLLERD